MSTGNSGYKGDLDANSVGADLNAWTFLVTSIMSRQNTSTLVRVLSCTNDGELAPVGFVDAELLVNQIDGNGVAAPNARLFNLPYLRIQGGTDGIIIDPKPGDIGVAVFASRDISVVKATKQAANPGSMRRFALADGIYQGGVCNGTPVQYIRFHPGGIDVTTPGNLLITVAGTTTVNSTGDVAVNTPANASIVAGQLCSITGTAGIRIHTDGTADVTIDGDINATVMGSVATTITGSLTATAATISLNP